MVDYDAACAAVQDPNADPAFLAKIAYENPEFGANVAANPHAYPGLLAWIAQFGTDYAKQWVLQNENLPAAARALLSAEAADGQAAQAAVAQSENQAYVQTATAAQPEQAQQQVDMNAVIGGFTPNQAMTTTDAMTQHTIAENVPELRAYLAMNPNVYPELKAWLSEQVQ